MAVIDTSFRPFIVGIGGTARSNSSSESAVREASKAAERLGAQTRLFDGDFISRLPLYSPERSDRSPEEQTYIDAVLGCHGIIVGTPGYHGSLSGPIKNVLDLLEDTARDERPYLDGRAFWLRSDRLRMASVRYHSGIATDDRSCVAGLANPRLA
jgi:FMN reductase